MSKKPSKNPSTNAGVTIEEQTAAFLKSGGTIQQIDKGASGHVNPTSSKQANVKTG